MIIVGLGNPGTEYENTRHNTGFIVAEEIAKNFDADEWREKKNFKIADAKVGKKKIQIVEPQTFMNNSGKAIKELITGPKKLKELVLIHDDLDLPIGKIKMSLNRGSGGHRGVESVIKAVGSENFIRLRVGISPEARGKIKKPKGGKDVEKHILSKFKPEELKTLKKESKKITEVLQILEKEGIDKAMGEINKK